VGPTITMDSLMGRELITPGVSFPQPGHRNGAAVSCMDDAR